MVKQAVCPRAVILTALPVEYRAVRRYLQDSREDPHKGTIYERGTFLTEMGQWRVGIVQVGAGNASAATQAERAINYFKPDVALFVGVAGGIKDVSIGDVVAATKAFCYGSGKADRAFLPRSEVGLATFRMEQRALATANNDDWLKRLNGATPEPKPCVHVAPIAAGEQVISSTRSVTYNFLRKQYSHVVAVEMEGFGFLQAVRANQHVDALVIRGISDLLDNKAEADAAHSQERASQHASAFAFEVLTKLSYDEDFMASVANARSAERLGEKKKPPTRYVIRNSGQMVAGDNAQMVNNWYRSPN
jgi:nucleoside phosphorylase